MTPQEEIAKLKEQKTELEAYLVRMIEEWIKLDYYRDTEKAAWLFNYFADGALDILAIASDYEPLPDVPITSPKVAAFIERGNRIAGPNMQE